MKRVTFIFPVVLCFTVLSSTINASISFATRENVDKKKQSIISYRKKGQIIDYSLGTVASGLCIFFGYKFYKWLTSEKEKESFKTLGNRDLTRKLAELEDKFEKHKDPSLLSKRWFRSTGKSLFTSFLSSSLAGIALKMFNKFYGNYHCFDNVKEFIDTRFGGLVFVDELLYNTQHLEHYAINFPENTQKGKRRFIVSLNNFVDNFEFIVAFMEYKVGSLEGIALSDEDILLSKDLFDCVNSYCAKVEKLFSDDFQEGQLFEITKGLRNDVIQFVEGFKGLENRVSWTLK